MSLHNASQVLSSSIAAVLSNSSSSSSSSSSGGYVPVDVDGFDLDNISVFGHHVPLGAAIAVICFIALLIVCVAVTCVCNGCLSCCSKTEEVVDDTVKDVKGWVHQRDLNKRKNKVQLLKAKHARSDYSATKV